MRFEQTFTVASSPESVFDYMTDPANLRDWQTSKTRVEVLSDGEPRQGYRMREWTKPPGAREFVQVVEFTEFDRPRRLHVHIVEGPYPVDGTWHLSPAGCATRVDFVAEGPLRGLMRVAAPIVTRLMARQFATYHENLRRNVESRA
ncbi:MAG: SRPBCC family protein [Solirubrobacteraceae bacterium]